MATAKKTAAPARRTMTTSLADSGAVVERKAIPNITLVGDETVDLGELVTVIVPKAFVLTRDDHSEVHFKQGTSEHHLADVEHWYAQANGVTVYAPDSKE